MTINNCKNNGEERNDWQAMLEELYDDRNNDLEWYENL